MDRYRSVEDVHHGEVWYHYGWGHWYYIVQVKSYWSVKCVAFRADGTHYDTTVSASFIIKGDKVFNRVRFKRWPSMYLKPIHILTK